MNPTTDLLHVLEGPITRNRIRKIQEAFEPKNICNISISNQEKNGVTMSTIWHWKEIWILFVVDI